LKIKDAAEILFNSTYIVGLIFAIINVRQFWLNKRREKEVENKDYRELVKENAKLKQRNEELQKLIL